MTAELILQGASTVSPQQIKICPLLLGLINWSFVGWGRWQGSAIYLFPKLCVKGAVWELLPTRGASASARYWTGLWCFERNSVILCVCRAEERVWWLLLCLFRLSSLEFWDYKLNTCKRCQAIYTLIVSPHRISASSDDISSRWHFTYWKCLTYNIFHESKSWSSWQQTAYVFRKPPLRHN